MSRTKVAAIIDDHACRVSGTPYRFQIESLAVEPKWSSARYLLGVRVRTDSELNGTLLHLLIRAGAPPAEVLSLLHDALAVSIADRQQSPLLQRAAN